MIASTGPLLPFMLRQPAPERGARACRQGLGANAHHAQAITAIAPSLASFHEEIDATLWPVHAAVTVEETSTAADLSFKAFQKMIEADQILESLWHLSNLRILAVVRALSILDARSSMQILLNPADTESGQLSGIYRRAIRSAVELHVATAYLTDWSAGTPLSKHCRRMVFLIGTDFGLTRKEALRSVLRWLPKHTTSLFSAVTGPASGGFHPKIVLWREKTGARWCLIGSSNLSRAAFSTNYEANVAVRVPETELHK